MCDFYWLRDFLKSLKNIEVRVGLEKEKIDPHASNLNALLNNLQLNFQESELDVLDCSRYFFLKLIVQEKVEDS